MPTICDGILKKCSNRYQFLIRQTQLQKAYISNIVRLAEMKKLALAERYVSRVKTVEEAQELTNSDPAIQAERLEMELIPWYGSAELMAVNNLHKKISREDI